MLYGDEAGTHPITVVTDSDGADDEGNQSRKRPKHLA